MSFFCVHKTVFGLGITELVFAIILWICGTATKVYGSHFSYVSHGLWGGAILSFTAAMAINAGYSRRTCLHITHMVFAIVSCVIILPLICTLFGIEIGYDQRYYKAYAAMIITGEIFAILCGSFLFILLIISATFTCCAVCDCCGANKMNGVVTPMANSSDTQIVLYPPVGSNVAGGHQMSEPPQYFYAANQMPGGQVYQTVSLAPYQMNVGQLPGQMLGYRNVGYILQPPAYNIPTVVDNAFNDNFPQTSNGMTVQGNSYQPNCKTYDV